MEKEPVKREQPRRGYALPRAPHGERSSERIQMNKLYASLAVLLFIEITVSSFAASPGSVWKEDLDKVNRYTYLVGFRDGKKEAFGRFTSMAKSSETNTVLISRETLGELYVDIFENQPLETILDMMTQLYDDPANTYIPWANMY